MAHVASINPLAALLKRFGVSVASAREFRVIVGFYCAPLLLALFWLAVFAPGEYSMTDPYAQIQQVLGTHLRSDWQPYFATSLMWILCRWTGLMFPYLVLQALLLGLAAGFTAQTLYQLGALKRRGAWVFSLAFLLWPAIVPLVADPTKDTLFLACLMIFFSLFARALSPKGRLGWAGATAMGVFGFSAFELRKNSILALVAVFLILAVRERRSLPKFGLPAALFATLVVLWAVFLSALNVRPAPWTEMISGPLQQVGAVFAAENPVPESAAQEFEKLLPAQSWKQFYTPGSSDGLKLSGGINNSKIEVYQSSELPKFLAAWAQTCAAAENFPVCLQGEWDLIKGWLAPVDLELLKGTVGRIPRDFQTWQSINWNLFALCEDPAPALLQSSRGEIVAGGANRQSIDQAARECYQTSVLNPAVDREMTPEGVEEVLDFGYNSPPKLSEDQFVAMVQSYAGVHSWSLFPDAGRAWESAANVSFGWLGALLWNNCGLPFWLLLALCALIFWRLPRGERSRYFLLALPAFLLWASLPLAAPVTLIRYVLPAEALLAAIVAIVARRALQEKP